ncbi:hypothetical protein HGQ98_03235 [Achromobacter ruhlandii]|uniref:Uncharacterized protein n=1 Tax=Achromobacter ruhlandii TaxID=72557 RepID=A0A848NCQ1_9BURK|nr:hypothetical protein [Achromobacter ruhlandii]NMU88897.1 hypothetical protein [Achromobacter ruhlandii]
MLGEYPQDFNPGSLRCHQLMVSGRKLKTSQQQSRAADLTGPKLAGIAVFPFLGKTVFPVKLEQEKS